MKRQLVILVVLLAVFTTACSSLNRATPESWDKAAIEAEVRGKVATAVTGKTFDIGVEVSDNRVVTLSGSVDTASDRQSIAEAARSVDGVTSVINNITIR